MSQVTIAPGIRRTARSCFVGLFVLAALALPAAAETIYFSDVANRASTPAIEDGDIVADDSASTSAADHTIFLSEGIFSADEDIDGFHLVSNTIVALSTWGAAQIGGLSFQNEDIILYDAVAGTASLLFDGSSVFAGNENVDAFHLLANGHILLSTRNAAQIGALSFGDQDIVEYDPGTGLASLFFEGNLHFAADEDIDAFFVRADGTLVLSTTGGATLGGVSFGDDDVVQYDPGTGTASVIYSIGNLPGNNNLDALFVPEASLALLLASVMLGLAWADRARN